MLEKTKSFVKDHQKEIVITGCVVAGIVTGVILRKRFDKELVDMGKTLVGKRWITWVPENNGFMNSERVKEVLDANANNSEMFAIVRGYREIQECKDAYTCLLLSDNVIMP